jgi:Prealbumin-like fold domain
VYTLSETGSASYTPGSWSCDGGTQNGATISVPLGGTVTCTITNDDTKSVSNGSTAQFFRPDDSVTITGRSPSGGDVTFELFDPASPECQGDPAWSQTVTLGADGTASTTNDGFVASTPGTWRWRVHYAGDQRNEPWTGGCGDESFTIANG